jgi:hypothetical protein
MRRSSNHESSRWFGSWRWKSQLGLAVFIAVASLLHFSSPWHLRLSPVLSSSAAPNTDPSLSETFETRCLRHKVPATYTAAEDILQGSDKQPEPLGSWKPVKRCGKVFKARVWEDGGHLPLLSEQKVKWEVSRDFYEQASCAPFSRRGLAAFSESSEWREQKRERGKSLKACGYHSFADNFDLRTSMPSSIQAEAGADGSCNQTELGGHIWRVVHRPESTGLVFNLSAWFEEKLGYIAITQNPFELNDVKLYVGPLFRHSAPILAHTHSLPPPPRSPLPASDSTGRSLFVPSRTWGSRRPSRTTGLVPLSCVGLS